MLLYCCCVSFPQVRFHYFGHGTDPIKINIYIRTMIGGPMTLVSSITNFDLDSFMSTEQYLVSMDDFDVSNLVMIFFLTYSQKPKLLINKPLSQITQNDE